MKTSDFYYDLPPELIAQTPIEKRDASRLLTLDKVTGVWEQWMALLQVRIRTFTTIV